MDNLVQYRMKRTRPASRTNVGRLFCSGVGVEASISTYYVLAGLKIVTSCRTTFSVKNEGDVILRGS